MPTSRFRELAFIEISTFVLVVMMNCSDTHPDGKIMKVSFPKGSLIQTFKMTWPQLAQGLGGMGREGMTNLSKSQTP